MNAFSPSSAFTVASGATLDLADFDQTIGSLAGAGSVTLGSATLSTGNDNTSTTFSGAISGTGGLTKVGAGTLTLSGVNSYTGGTALNAGTLAVGSNAALGTGPLTFANGATLQSAADGLSLGNAITLNGAGIVDTQTNTLALSGTISGSGGLTKIGTGTLVLAGANTFSGGTTLAAGMLSLANNQALGNGALTTSGVGVDYANGITIANSIVLNTNTTQLQVTTGTATQAGAISELNGPRGIDKTGAGTLVLTGANTYTGPTTVSGGSLIVNGSAGNSTITVNAGGTVGGTATLGNIIINGGTLSPGNSIGTITASGTLTFASGSTYLVEASPSSADFTNVAGATTLAGTVLAAFSPGRYVPNKYTILHANGGLGGTFNLNTTNLPANFGASLSYTATDVVLNLTAALGAGAVLSLNQQNIAGAINNFFNNGSNTFPPAFVNIFGLTGTNLTNGLTLLSGEAATGAQQGAFQLTNQFLGIMLDPFVDGRSAGAPAGGPALAFAPEREELPDDIALAYAKVLKAPPKPPTFEQRWSVWGAGFGGTNRTTGDQLVAGSHDLSARTAGGTAGLDYHLTRDSVIGFALAGGGTAWSLANGLGGGKSDAFQAGVYGATRSGPAYLAAAFAFTNHWMSTDRFAFAGDHLTASFNAQSFGGRLEGGYRFGTFYGGLTPYAAIQAQNFRTPGYSETDLTNGGFALSYNSRTATDTRSELGARFDNQTRLDPYRVLTLRARLAWAHDWISDPTLAAVFQTLPGASFIVNGATPAKNSALTSAGAELRLANGVTLLAKFDGEFASHSSTYAGTGTVRYTW